MRPAVLLVPILLYACSPNKAPEARVGADTLVIYNASSLAGPMRALLDTFSHRTGTVIAEEHGASLELARRITELHRIPDVIALADREVFPELLVPGVTTWYASFARNRMVVAYTDRSRGATSINAANWRLVLQRPDVLVGRTDPVLAPAGYRTLLLYQLAEKFYGEPGLAAKLAARTPASRIRANAADLAALLSAGELDYIVDYESLARAQKLRFVTLPPEIDLGTESYAATYATSAVKVASQRDTLLRVGAPILYAMSVPRAAPHAEAGRRFAQFVLGAEGRGMLRAQNVDALDRPAFTGLAIPVSIRDTTRP